jgi:SAM-dependent methyltransferase
MASASRGFREEFFRELAALEATNFWFRARNELIMWAIRKSFPKFQRFLEVGCGTGYVLSGIHEAFPSAELFASEIFTTGLDFAARRVPTATFYQMDARSIPFRDHFDLVGAFDVVEHIQEDERVFGEVLRALRPGGGFVLTVPQHPALWSQQDEHAEHVRRYTATGLHRKLTTSGFEIVRSVSFVSLLLPVMFVSRMRMRESRAKTAFDPMDALRLPRTLNIPFEAVMTVERALIRHGISFPAGGSLLLAARRPRQATPA